MSNCNTILEALVVSPHQTGVLLNCGRTRVYELLAAGELDSFRDGRARKITVASIHRYIERRLAAEAPPTSVDGLPGEALGHFLGNTATASDVGKTATSDARGGRPCVRKSR